MAPNKSMFTNIFGGSCAIPKPGQRPPPTKGNGSRYAFCDKVYTTKELIATPAVKRLKTVRGNPITTKKQLDRAIALGKLSAKELVVRKDMRNFLRKTSEWDARKDIRGLLKSSPYSNTQKDIRGFLKHA